MFLSFGCYRNMNVITQFNLKPFWTDKLLLIYSGWYGFHTGRKQFHVQYYKTIIFCTFLNCRASFLGNSALFSVEPNTLQFTVNQYFRLTAFPSPLCEGTHTHTATSLPFQALFLPCCPRTQHEPGGREKERAGIFILHNRLLQRWKVNPAALTPDTNLLPHSGKTAVTTMQSWKQPGLDRLLCAIFFE